MSGGACACCSSMGRSPPRKPRSATCPGMKRRTSACWPRRHASPSACSPGCPRTSSTGRRAKWWCSRFLGSRESRRSEEHTSELQSRLHLVCRLLLEKKKKKKGGNHSTNDHYQTTIHERP